ncbi:MAG: DedA family protein [bacterium]
MSWLVQVILPYLLLYKYGAIFVITFIAAFAFPVPPGTLLMASAAFASQGYLSFFWIVVWGSLGNIVGDNVGYYVARRYGKRILNQIGFRKILASEKYATFEQRIQSKPAFLIFITRFEVVSNLCVNIICGLGEVPYRKYIVYESIGEILQVLLYCTIGYYVGDNWPSISALVSKFLLSIIVVAIILLAVFWKRIWKRAKQHS